MTNPSSPLSSTSSLTAESIGAQSASRHHLDNDKSDTTVGRQRPASASSRRSSSSSSSTLTTTTVMLPSDDERDDSDLTEAEEEEDVPRTLQGVDNGGEQTQPDSPLLSDVDDSESDRSPSLSPLPSAAIPDAGDPASQPNDSPVRSILDYPTKLAAALAADGDPNASPVSDVSDGDEEPGFRKGDPESDQESEDAESDNVREPPLGPALVDESASASPTSNRSQSEQQDDRPDGEMEVGESFHEGSVIDDDDASLTSPMFPSSSRSGHGTHAPPPTMDAMRAMFLLELKFAALRDQLYIDRLDEAAREEDLILTGLHPAVVYLHSTLVRRRERLHADARRRHKMALSELQRAKEVEKAAVANWWLETREATQWTQYEGNWRKRRRLNREKSELEILRPVKSLPPRFPSDKDMDDRSFRWSGGPRASTLSTADIGQDLTNMGLRSRPAPYSRHASPAYFPPGLAGHPNAVMGHYSGGASKPTSIFSNVYRPPPAQVYYQEEVIDYGLHSHQDNLQRQQNGAKQGPPARLYPHVPFQPESHEPMFAHAQSNSLLSGLASGSSNSTHNAAQRREGRMVPTTDSSIFDARRRDKDRAREKPYKTREGAVEQSTPPLVEYESRPSLMEPDRLQVADGRSFGEGQTTEANGAERSESSQLQSMKAFGSKSMAWPYGGERPFVNPGSNSPSNRAVVTVDAE